MAKIAENPRGTCVLGGASAALSAVEGVTPVFHTGPGCPMMTALGQLMSGGGKGGANRVGAPCSVMLEREVVFGGLDRLRETIDGTIEIFEAQLYFILTGCSAGIIGEDVRSVVSEYREKGVPITYADATGFRGDVYTGYDAVLTALLDTLTEDCADAEKEAHTVNLFGIVPTQDLYWHGNLREMQNLLRGIGVKANIFFGMGQGLGAFREAARASVNIFLSSWVARGTEDFLKDKHGMPAFRFDSYPIGPTETTKFLYTVGDLLGISKSVIDDYVDREESYIYDFFSAIAGMAGEQQRVAIIGDANTIVSTLRFLVNDYSRIPVLAVVTDLIEQDEDVSAVTAAIQNLEYHAPPEVVFESDQWHIRALIAARKDELTQLYGSQLDRPIAMENKLLFVNHTFPNSEKLVLDKAFAGYRGCLSFIEDSFNTK